MAKKGYTTEQLINKLRNKLLIGEIFTIIIQAKVLIEQWRMDYNHIRPHSSLGYRPPAPEAIMMKIKRILRFRKS